LHSLLEGKMLDIETVSDLAQVSADKATQYVQAGLVKPMAIEPTGRPVYCASQAQELCRLAVLDDLGLLSLRIEGSLGQNLSVEELRTILTIQQADLRIRQRAEQARLEEVQARLDQINGESQALASRVQVKVVAQQTVASIREVIPTREHVLNLIKEIHAFLPQWAIRPTGAAIAVFLDDEYREHDIDVEVGIPVDQPFAGTGRIVSRTLPEAKLALSVIHQGGFHSISLAYAALMAWLEIYSYAMVGAIREIFLSRPDVPGQAEQYIIEVQIPVARFGRAG
jgi:effector-binding domain-containing protein